MTRHLIRIGLTLAGNALGLWIASLVLDDMQLTGAAFILAVLIFTALEFVLHPVVAKTASEHAPILENVGSLITTFLALLATALISDGLDIDGTLTWVWATLIVWAVTLVAGYVLPKFFLDEPDAK